MIAALACFGVLPPLMLHRGQADITPSEPLPLGGYTARGGKVMEGVGERLWARAALFEQGETRLALVSVEMLTVPESLAREVQAKVGPQVKVVLVATHTHCAPDSQMLNDRMTFSLPGVASFKSGQLARYSDQIAGAVRSARANPGQTVKDMRLVSAFLFQNRARRLGAMPDRRVRCLKVNGKPVLVIYSAHATLNDSNVNVTSGDWPGAASALMSDALVLPGAIGDVSPVAPEGDGPAPIRFAQGILGSLSRAGEGLMLAPVLRLAEAPIELGPAEPHPDFARSNGIPQALARTLAQKFAPPAAGIQGFSFGNFAVAAVPGEPTSSLGEEIRTYGRELGFADAAVLSHANGWVGYILTPGDYDRGGYEATLAMNGRMLGPRVVKAAETCLDQLTARAALSR